MPQTRWEQLTIASGDPTSDSVDVAFGESVVGVETPAAWTDADIVFQISRDGTNFVDLMDMAGVLLRLTTIDTNAAELRSVGDDLTALDLPLGACKLRLRSCNTASAADVNQGDERILHVLLEKA